jgi:hypothetical protein
MSEKFECNLKCWTCGKLAPIETNGPPQFAFEVAEWAKDIGGIGIIDLRRARSLVFCSESCEEAAKTKSGSFRLRPRHGTAAIQNL